MMGVMALRLIYWSVLVLFLAGQPSSAADPPEPCAIDLIKLLDHPQFAVRDQATRKLDRMGESALQPIMSALAQQPRPETTARLKHLLLTMQPRVMSEAFVLTLRASTKAVADGDSVRFIVTMRNASKVGWNVDLGGAPGDFESGAALRAIYNNPIFFDVAPEIPDGHRPDSGSGRRYHYFEPNYSKVFELVARYEEIGTYRLARTRGRILTPPPSDRHEFAIVFSSLEPRPYRANPADSGRVDPAALYWRGELRSNSIIIERKP